MGPFQGTPGDGPDGAGSQVCVVTTLLVAGMASPKKMSEEKQTARSCCLGRAERGLCRMERALWGLSGEHRPHNEPGSFH